MTIFLDLSYMSIIASDLSTWVVDNAHIRNFFLPSARNPTKSCQVLEHHYFGIYADPLVLGQLTRRTIAIQF